VSNEGCVDFDLPIGMRDVSDLGIKYDSDTGEYECDEDLEPSVGQWEFADYGIGDMVIAGNLVNAQHLNGCKGMIISRVAETSRFGVKFFESGSVKSVRAENLRIAWQGE